MAVQLGCGQDEGLAGPRRLKDLFALSFALPVHGSDRMLNLHQYRG